MEWLFVGILCLSRNTIDCEIVDLVNIERAKVGSSSLEHSQNCQNASDFHVDDMKKNNFLSHRSSDGTSALDRLRRFGVEGYWGENIAWNNSGLAKEVVAQWMRSKGHRKNILNPKFRSMAAGSAEPYFVQCFSSDVPDKR